jgi:hypothetical protein
MTTMMTMTTTTTSKMIRRGATRAPELSASSVSLTFHELMRQCQLPLLQLLLLLLPPDLLLLLLLH